jgi:hypothetical protein
MAKAKSKNTEAVDDAKQYHVKVNRPVQVFEHSVIAPHTDNVLRGDFLKTVPADAIESIEEVE